MSEHVVKVDVYKGRLGSPHPLDPIASHVNKDVVALYRGGGPDSVQDNVVRNE